MLETDKLYFQNCRDSACFMVWLFPQFNDSPLTFLLRTKLNHLLPIIFLVFYGLNILYCIQGIQYKIRKGLIKYIIEKNQIFKKEYVTYEKYKYFVINEQFLVLTFHQITYTKNTSLHPPKKS